MAERHGIKTLDFTKDTVGELRGRTGRGPDSVLDAVGMEAHGSPVSSTFQQATGLLPDKAAQLAMENVSADRTSVLDSAIDAVRRGGTLSISGVYDGPPPRCRCSSSSTSRSKSARASATSVPGPSTCCRWPRIPATRWAWMTWSPRATAFGRSADVRDFPEEAQAACIKVVLKP